jgi:hypothetical protein
MRRNSGTPGLFTRDSPFRPLPELPTKSLEEIFGAHAIQLLVDLDLLPYVRVRLLHSWKHSGSENRGM